MAQIDMACGPYRIVSLMSREAADDLGLKPGDQATALIKSTTGGRGETLGDRRAATGRASGNGGGPNAANAVAAPDDRPGPQVPIRAPAACRTSGSRAHGRADVTVGALAGDPAAPTRRSAELGLSFS